MDRFKTFSLLFAGIAVIAWIAASQIRPESLVAIFDVGQGDAIFITTSSGEDILIDGGPNSLVLDGLGSALPIQDRDIEVMILTHPHADHLNGLVDVVERYDVKRILCACEGGESEGFDAWKTAAVGDAPVEQVEKPQEIDFSGGAKLYIYHPPAGDTLNDQSLIVLYEDRGKRFLFTGDAEMPSEKWLVEQGFAEDVDVLKIGHHGSRSATSPQLLGAIKPEVAVISVGQPNKYDHPHAETLATLASKNIPILRTDESGSVFFWQYKGVWRTSAVHDRLMPFILDLWYNQTE